MQHIRICFFIEMQKMLGTNERDIHRKISSMCDITKLIIVILGNRGRSKIRQEIGE